MTQPQVKKVEAGYLVSGLMLQAYILTEKLTGPSGQVYEPFTWWFTNHPHAASSYEAEDLDEALQHFARVDQISAKRGWA